MFKPPENPNLGSHGIVTSGEIVAEGQIKSEIIG